MTSRIPFVGDLAKLRDPSKFGHTLYNSPPKFSMLTPKAKLGAWLKFAWEPGASASQVDAALAGARKLNHRTADAIEWLTDPHAEGSDFELMRFLPDLDLEATPQLCAELVVQAQVDARDASFEAEGYRVFRRKTMQRVAAMHGAGIAEWFGAIVDGLLVADCGLVHDGRLGRFQFVETQAAWRRRGLCRALVHHVCQHAFLSLGSERLVMCADPHDVAIGIYRSVGFVEVERHWCLQGRPPRDR